MTLFHPAVIEAQRRRVYGSVTLHQPARLAAFTAVAVISVGIGTAYLALGQYARKETVAGWIAPEAELSAVYARVGAGASAALDLPACLNTIIKRLRIVGFELFLSKREVQSVAKALSPPPLPPKGARGVPVGP